MATAQETFAMLEKQSLWDTAALCHATLDQAHVPHLIVGGVAVCLHGYQRTTVDLDILVRREDAERIRASLAGAAFSWDDAAHEFRSAGGIQVKILTAGERAGAGSEVVLPDPADAAAGSVVEGLPVLSLARLIEIKIACGEGNVRRTHKDFADVVELIAANGLDGTFARHLHKSVRAAYRKLVKNAHG